MPMFIHASIATLHEQDGVKMQTVARMLKHVVERATRLLRSSEADVKTFQVASDRTKLYVMHNVMYSMDH